jgi:hypothetical protein
VTATGVTSRDATGDESHFTKPQARHHHPVRKSTESDNARLAGSARPLSPRCCDGTCAESATCIVCGSELEQPATGRPRTYCGEPCRRAAEYELRRAQSLLLSAERSEMRARSKLSRWANDDESGWRRSGGRKWTGSGPGSPIFWKSAPQSRQPALKSWFSDTFSASFAGPSPVHMARRASKGSSNGRGHVAGPPRSQPDDVIGSNLAAVTVGGRRMRSGLAAGCLPIWCSRRSRRPSARFQTGPHL